MQRNADDVRVPELQVSLALPRVGGQPALLSRAEEAAAAARALAEGHRTHRGDHRQPGTDTRSTAIPSSILTRPFFVHT